MLLLSWFRAVNRSWAPPLALGVLLASSGLVHAQALDRQPIYVAGEDYNAFRIPAIVEAADGTLLAFAEGRASTSDTGDIDVVLRRSFDGGETWQPLQQVAECQICGSPIGYLTGAPSFGSTPALDFTSADDSVTAGDVLDFGAADSFTIEAVLRTNSNATMAIVAKDWGAAKPSWWLRLNAGRLEFLVSDGTGGLGQGEFKVLGSVSVDDNAWHHVAAVRDAAAGTLRVYVDGVLDASAAEFVTEDLANFRDLRIGAFNDGNRQLDGFIDMVRVSGAALAPSSFLPAAAASVLARWDFNEQVPGGVAAVGDLLLDSVGGLDAHVSGDFGTAGNPAPVVDRNTGRIHLLTTHNLATDTETAIRLGTSQDTRRVWSQYSDDHGASWTAPVEITSSVKQPNWRWYATGPVHGIRLERGHQAGRLVVPANHSTNQGPSDNALGAHAIFSDDGGNSWTIGGIDSPGTGLVNPSETTVVELVGVSAQGDSQLHFDTRDQNGSSPGTRASTTSSDGGESFDTPFAADPSLVCPVVQGALLRFSATDTGGLRDRILFSCPDDPSSRVDMTVRSSLDEAQSFDPGKSIFEAFSAYSDMVRISSDDRIGLLFEAGDAASYERIELARFSEGWLDDPSLALWGLNDVLPGGTVPTTPGAVVDSRGYGLHATSDSAFAVVAGDPAYGGSPAVAFDGNGGIRLADAASAGWLDFGSVDSFTLEAIFQTTSHGSGNPGTLVGKGVGSPSWWLAVENGALRFQIDDGSDAPSATSPAAVNDGAWHHAAAIRDAGAGEIRLYVDGSLVASAPDPTPGSVATAVDTVVGSVHVPGWEFVGSVDLVRVSLGALDAADFLQSTACGNGFDDDGDGKMDHPDDVGCFNRSWPFEDPQCSDGIDNGDADLLADWDGAGLGAADPQCVGKPWRNNEAASSACGLGFEVALALPLLALRRQRGRSGASRFRPGQLR